PCSRTPNMCGRRTTVCSSWPPSCPRSSQNPFDDPRQHHVHGAQEQRHHHGHRDHDDRGVDQLLAAGPCHLAKLRHDLSDKLLCAPQKIHLLPSPSNNGRGGGIRTPIPRIWSPVL